MQTSPNQGTLVFEARGDSLECVITIGFLSTSAD